MTLRSVSKRRLVHLGEVEGFKLELRPVRSSVSDEGVGLSVMDDDEEVIDAWREIAKLGLSDEIRLTRRDDRTGRFLLHVPALDHVAVPWAIARGWASPATIWRVWFVERGDGDEEPRYAVFSSRAEADREAVALRDDSAYARVRVQRLEGIRATKRLVRRWQRVFQGHTGDELDFAFTMIEVTNLYVSEVHPDYDGVWWNDRLDVDRLSAPRGVILPHALDRWEILGGVQLASLYGWRSS